MLSLLSDFNLSDLSLSQLSTNNKLLINTLNAHSFNTTHYDVEFKIALQQSNVLLSDGISIVGAMRLLTGQRLRKIAGADLFFFEMERLNVIGGKCFFLGSSDKTLHTIQERAANEYPKVQVYSYSPPYKAAFSDEENKIMIDAVNAVEPDVLFIGMTAPKQEKWAFQHFDQLNATHIGCIGAVFDFYAGTVNRAPKWMIKIGLEWFYRLVKEPKRMWRRYLLGNLKFIGYVVREKWMIRKFKNHP